MASVAHQQFAKDVPYLFSCVNHDLFSFLAQRNFDRGPDQNGTGPDGRQVSR
jgi:hypothetical protein